MSTPTRVLDQRHLHLDRHGDADAPDVPVLLVSPPQRRPRATTDATG